MLSIGRSGPPVNRTLPTEMFDFTSVGFTTVIHEHCLNAKAGPSLLLTVFYGAELGLTGYRFRHHLALSQLHLDRMAADRQVSQPKGQLLAAHIELFAQAVTAVEVRSGAKHWAE